jgi:hypothetical protein
MNTVVCKNCSWISFAVTREFAENEVNRFNEWFDKQPPETQECYSGHSSVDDYTCLHCCRSDFRPFDPTIDPDITGSTIGPVIYES